jgi:hypothetical protein
MWAWERNTSGPQDPTSNSTCLRFVVIRHAAVPPEALEQLRPHDRHRCEKERNEARGPGRSRRVYEEEGEADEDGDEDELETRKRRA